MSDGAKTVGQRVAEAREAAQKESPAPQPVELLTEERRDVGRAMGRRFPVVHLVVLNEVNAQHHPAIAIGGEYFFFPGPSDRHLIGIPNRLVAGAGATAEEAWGNALKTARETADEAVRVRHAVAKACPKGVLSATMPGDDGLARSAAGYLIEMRCPRACGIISYSHECPTCGLPTLPKDFTRLRADEQRAWQAYQRLLHDWVADPSGRPAPPRPALTGPPLNQP